MTKHITEDTFYELYEYDEESMVYRKIFIDRESDNEHWTQIKVIAYIVGDVYALRLVEYANRYTFVAADFIESLKIMLS